jgi:hypothetical protein
MRAPEIACKCLSVNDLCAYAYTARYRTRSVRFQRVSTRSSSSGTSSRAVLRSHRDWSSGGGRCTARAIRRAMARISASLGRGVDSRSRAWTPPSAADPPTAGP